MKITRTLLTAASALAMIAGSVTPALASRFTPPIATTTLRRSSEIRELYADAFSSILELSKMYRSEAMQDTTGRSLLARSQVRAAQRNFRRHVLGYLRGVDYRILNVSGDLRRQGLKTAGNLPFSLVQTGAGEDNVGNWMWDRPTRRDVRLNDMFGITTRDRDILGEQAARHVR